MFNPSRDEVRLFFIETWRKHHASQSTAVLTPLETLALNWMIEHPEYHSLLETGQEAVARDFTPEQGETNPFLHLSMHLSITEQVSIDQPPGIRAAVEKLARRLDSVHQAHHQVMECLGEMLWKAQRSGLPPDGVAYIDSINRRAGRIQ